MIERERVRLLLEDGTVLAEGLRAPTELERIIREDNARLDPHGYRFMYFAISGFDYFGGQR